MSAMPLSWQRSIKTRLAVSFLVSFGVAAVPKASGQAAETQPGDPATALSEALAAACRHNEEKFARYLTADNAAAFRVLAPAARTALLKRFVLLDEAGRPLLSSDAQGHTVLRCETSGITAEIRLGEPRVRENLAFVNVEALAPRAQAEPAEKGEPGRRVEFGMVREGGGWKLLSVGLLLLDLPTLARQWELGELEAGEAAAIAALRRLADALGTYRRAFGHLPETLAQMGPAPKEGISPEAAGLVDAELAASKKGGYVFRYRILAKSAHGGAGETSDDASFELAAVPAEYGKMGRRSFFLDASGTLRGGDKKGAVATAADPRIEPR